MSDPEFDLLDELYFVQPYRHLSQALGWNDELILRTLTSLSEKGWIRCYLSPTEEVLSEKPDLINNYKNYYYLASKKGLFAHNSKE